jgi:hypothetical protein
VFVIGGDAFSLAWLFIHDVRKKKHKVTSLFDLFFWIFSGLFEEIGPCGVNSDATQDIYNEVGSWNKVANLLFLDQVMSFRKKKGGRKKEGYF